MSMNCWSSRISFALGWGAVEFLGDELPVGTGLGVSLEVHKLFFLPRFPGTPVGMEFGLQLGAGAFGFGRRLCGGERKCAWLEADSVLKSSRCRRAYGSSSAMMRALGRWVGAASSSSSLVDGQKIAITEDDLPAIWPLVAQVWSRRHSPKFFFQKR